MKSKDKVILNKILEYYHQADEACGFHQPTVPVGE